MSFLQRALRHKSFVSGGVLVLLLIATALLSFVWTPYPAADLDIPNKLQLPSAAHWLGTDSLGRDIASLLIVGARNSIAVGVIAVGIGIAFGVALGLLAAARRGWVEELVMRFSDFAFAFPALLSAIMLTALYGPGLVTSIVAIGIFNVPVFARITRAAANGVWSREFVLAARSLGAKSGRVIAKEILPNLVPAMLTVAVTGLGILVAAEGALAFLGLGVERPLTWGKMISDGSRDLSRAWWATVFPCVFLFLTVISFNLIGDRLARRFDIREAAI